MSYEIKKYHGAYNRSRRTQDITYIVIHYTGSGSSKSGCALANCQYFAGGDRQASAHYFIDDTNIYEYADPTAYYTWHCGDGHGRYGIRNGNSIGIEVCSSGADYTPDEISRLTWLVQQLMSRYNIDAAHVVRHYDASRKACPWPYVPNGGDPTGQKWARLHAIITGSTTADTDTTDNTDSSKRNNLLVDGILGPASIKAWQRALGSNYVDGIISGQYRNNYKYYNAIIDRCLTWDATGSTMVRLLQATVHVPVDGILGRETVKGIQRYLGGLEVDGYLGTQTARAIQTRLNRGGF